MDDALVSDLLRQASINTENHLMFFSGSSWKYFTDTGRIKVSFIIFHKGGTIDQCTHVPVPVSQ